MDLGFGLDHDEEEVSEAGGGGAWAGHGCWSFRPVADHLLIIKVDEVAEDVLLICLEPLKKHNP